MSYLLIIVQQIFNGTADIGTLLSIPQCHISYLTFQTVPLTPFPLLLSLLYKKIYIYDCHLWYSMYKEKAVYVRVATLDLLGYPAP